MSRRKDDSIDDSDIITGKSLATEALRLMADHRHFFHQIVEKDCRLCRSFRRTILGGLSK